MLFPSGYPLRLMGVMFLYNVLYNKSELHLEFEGNMGPESLIYKYLLMQEVLWLHS